MLCVSAVNDARTMRLLLVAHGLLWASVVVEGCSASVLCIALLHVLAFGFVGFSACCGSVASVASVVFVSSVFCHFCSPSWLFGSWSLCALFDLCGHLMMAWYIYWLAVQKAHLQMHMRI